MLSLLSLHGSGRDETDLADFCHQLAPQARFIAPRGPFAQAGGYTFFRRRSDRSIDAAEVLNLATAWVSQEAEAHLRASGEVIAVGYSSGAIFAEALLSVAPDKFAGAILMRPEPLSPKCPLNPFLSWQANMTNVGGPTMLPFLLSSWARLGLGSHFTL